MFKRRRYFRISPNTDRDIVSRVMEDFDIREISCFTSADYEHVFSLYCTPGTSETKFSKLFDFVCLETTGNENYINKAKFLNSGKVIEIEGETRNKIERMVLKGLKIAHSTELKIRHLPKVIADSTLRPYQAETKARIIEAWKYDQRVMLQMPTGTGKTWLFVSLINDIHTADPTARILIVTHRKELVEQASKTLTSHYHLPHDILGKNSDDANNNILLASIQKLSRMQELPTIDYIIVDEAHHCLAPSYKKLMERCPLARVLGVTATPCRLKAKSFRDIFGELLLSHSIRWFINNGFLADYRLFTVSENNADIVRVNRLKKFGSNGDYRTEDLQEIVNVDSEVEKLYNYYETYANGKQGIIYAVSRDHAARIASVFNAHGVSAVSLDCDAPSQERTRIVNEFKSGKGIKVMVNVELFTEGFDCPDMEFVMLARPTRSLAMYLQQVGRALRPSSNGKMVTILDAAGLYNRFGLPERQRNWQKLFIGERPQGEKYTSRPLGTPEIKGLMKDVAATEVKAKIVNNYGDYSVCDFGGGRLGILDKAGRQLYPVYYTNISSYADGWFVGERRKDGKNKVFDILVPQQCASFTYKNFISEGNGTYSVEVSNDLWLHFENHLQLIPTSSFESGGTTIYQHGENKKQCIYTLSLTLGSMEFTNLTRYVSGIIKLTSSWYESAVFACCGDIFRLPKDNYYSLRHYYSDDKRLHVLTFYGVLRRVSDHPVLYMAINNEGVALCDKSFESLCKGSYMEVTPGECVIYKEGKGLQIVSFVDYLCMVKYGLLRFD